MCQTLHWVLGMWRLKTQSLPQPVGRTQSSHLWVRSSGGMELVCASLAYNSQLWAFLPSSGLSNCPGGSIYSTEINKSQLPRPSQPFTSTSLPTEHVSGVLSGGLSYLLWRAEGRPPRGAQVRFTNPGGQDDGGRGHSGKGTGVCSQGIEGTANR